MPLQVDDDGGGTTTSVCSPSPSDQVAILNNLISRIADIEKFLSQIVAADVYASNLSELAKDLGNVLNGTIILPSTGSPLGPGGSIPVPPDFSGTVISGNVITTWTNGVVSFEVTPSDGATTGAGVRDYLILEPASSSLSGSGLNETADLSTVLWSLGSTFGVGNLSTSQIDINQDGVYRISIQMLVGARSTSGSTWVYARVRDAADTTIKEVQDLFGQNASPANNANQTFKISFTFVALAGYDVIIRYNNTSGTIYNTTASIVSIEKIG